MKFITIILSILILQAPLQLHVDVIAFDDANTHHKVDTTNFNEDHHQQDNDSERNSEHHHHCVDLSVSHSFTPSNFNCTFASIFIEKKAIISHKNLHGKSCLDSIFQPPQA